MQTEVIGGEEMNEQANLIDRKEENDVVTRIENLFVEVETYKQAIQDARDALASAEEELDDMLAMQYEDQ